jgi:hypothetical protein
MDFSQLNHVFHTIIGSLAFLGGIIALSTKKGSHTHKVGGRIFAFGMLYAAISTIGFMFEEFLPLAILLSIATAYLVISSIASLWHRKKYVKVIDNIMILVPLVLFLFTSVQFVKILPEMSLGTFSRLLFAITFGILLYRDIRLIKNRPDEEVFYIKRHAFRMILAFGFALMAFLRIGIKFDFLGLAFTTFFPLLMSLITAFYVEQNISRILFGKK